MTAVQDFFPMHFLLAIILSIEMILCISCRSKAPEIEWQKTYGGSLQDEAKFILQTRDGGYIVIGAVNSDDGDVTFNHGFSDWWIIKLDAKGNLEWQKSYGGSYFDEPAVLIQTEDSGFLAGGFAYSYDGEVHGNHGRSDIWLLKLDQTGDIQWQRTLGGQRHDFLNSVIPSNDHTFLIVGSKGIEDSLHSSGIGLTDAFIAKINGQGSVLWEKTYGGNRGDGGYSAFQQKNNRYIIFSGAASHDGDVKFNHSDSSDFWIFAIDSSGYITSQRSYGGFGVDVPLSCIKTGDGGFAVAGNTTSNDGDVKGNHGMTDIWVIKLDSNLNIQWQHCYGGSLVDKTCNIIQLPDGGFIIGGITNSIDGDVKGNHGLYDGWIIRIDKKGKLKWQKCLGGSNDDGACFVTPTPDNGLIMAGYSNSKDGDVTRNQGDRDWWIVKLKPQ